MDLECPYCEKEFNICHDDGFGYAEGVKHHIECPNCEKSFVFETSISFDYEPSVADCLNGEEHDWKLTRTYPKAFSRMECSMCGDLRELTQEERTNFGIETKESYFANLNNQSHEHK